MRNALLALLAVATSGCSTVSARRSEPPVIDRFAPRNLAAFQECFAASVADVTPPPAYLPRGNGGTYTYTINSYVMWVIDVSTEGDGVRVRVFSRGQRADFEQMIGPCL